MKKLVLSAAAASLFATSALAGSLVAPDPEPMAEIAQESESPSSDGLLVPLLALLALGVLISQRGDDLRPG